MFRRSISLLRCLTFRSARNLTRPIGFLAWGLSLLEWNQASSLRVSVLIPPRTESSFVTLSIPRELNHQISLASSFTPFRSIGDVLIGLDWPHRSRLFRSAMNGIIKSRQPHCLCHFLSTKNWTIKSASSFLSFHSTRKSLIRLDWPDCSCCLDLLGTWSSYHLPHCLHCFDLLRTYLSKSFSLFMSFWSPINLTSGSNLNFCVILIIQNLHSYWPHCPYHFNYSEIKTLGWPHHSCHFHALDSKGASWKSSIWAVFLLPSSRCVSSSTGKIHPVINPIC